MQADHVPNKIELAQEATAGAYRDLRACERKIEELVRQIPTAAPASLANMRSELAMLLLTKMAIEAEIPGRIEYEQKMIKGGR